ncbi:MAG: hypothetical protein IJ824_06565 [Alphaproteobacteria bacterium]|nr:hypothetical protein [Alphaproteobacteria bacterium]
MNYQEFFKTLGLGIALAFAFAVVLFFLHWNWRITLWGMVIFCVFMRYWNKYEICIGSRLGKTFQDLFGLMFGVLMFWLMGLGSEYVFGYPADYFEITALKGVAIALLIVGPITIFIDELWYKQPKNYFFMALIYAVALGIIWLSLNIIFPYLRGLF